jgi:hypothetical protein
MWYPALREQQGLREFENRVLRRMFANKVVEVIIEYITIVWTYKGGG